MRPGTPKLCMELVLAGKKPPAAQRGTCRRRNCDRNVSALGLCGPHYDRFIGKVTEDKPIRPYGSGRTCSIDGCDEKHEARGFCKTHYHEKRRNGEFGDIAVPCIAPECDRIAVAKGLCSLHYRRQVDGLALDWVRAPVTSQHMHVMLKKLWGPARNYQCIECGEAARHWAYDGTDPTQHLGWPNSSAKNKAWYSTSPELYMPMCVKCHAIRDGAKVVEELLEYREWKYATRMRLSDIAMVKLGIPA